MPKQVVLLALVFLCAVPAYADLYTFEFSLETGGPMPLSGGFDYDPAQAKFTTPIIILWMDLDNGPLLGAQYNLDALHGPIIHPSVEGCPGALHESWFAFLTGQCGPATYNFTVNSGNNPNTYDLTSIILSDSRIEAFHGAGSFSTSEPIQGFLPHAVGTMVAHPVPEASSMVMLAMGLAALRLVRRKNRS